MRQERIWPSPIRVRPGKWILKMHLLKQKSDWINTVVLYWGPCCSCVQVIWQCPGIIFHCHIWGTREGDWHLRSGGQRFCSTPNSVCRMVSITMNYLVPSVNRVKTGKAWINDKFFVNTERFSLVIYDLKYMFEVSFGFIQTLWGALLQCSCFHFGQASEYLMTRNKCITLIPMSGFFFIVVVYKTSIRHNTEFYGKMSTF